MRTRPQFAVINVRGLILIYLLLFILTVLFSRFFVTDLLETGSIPPPMVLAVFFVIPAVLFIMLLVSGIRIVRDIFTREPGSRFQIRLLAYFVILVILAAAPVTLITSLSVSELLRFWKTIDVDNAMAEAQRFAMESYSLKLEKLQKTAEETDFRIIFTDNTGFLPEGIIAAEEFRLNDESWSESDFAGDEGRRLSAVPSLQSGFASRLLPRDIDVIRYIMLPEPGLIRVVTLDLGKNFDAALDIISEEKYRFEKINSIRLNIRQLLIFYYGVFFLPALLMTLIIAFSFTGKLSSPIEELTDATRRVAEGDFSLRILPRKGDELALLIQSFNSMVKDLEKSRAALLKAEKISLWQDIAQRFAHEIKNPLTPIRLSAERVLRRWQNEPEKIGDILENSMLVIVQEVESLSMLLGDFRTFSRPMEISGEKTDLLETITENILPYSSSHPQINFHTENTGSGISLKIEKHRLSQILNNLFVNAIDAMNREGTIEIRTDLVKKEDGSYCRLSIRDTGRGISKENSQYIFSPYFTTKETGTGLGLPIIERIVNDHGGIIWFDSGEGAGTTFYIDLPLEKEK